MDVNWAARRMNQARNRTVSNTLFMRIASPAHVIRPLLGVELSRSLHVPLLWFAYERKRLNLINPRVLKIERGLHLNMLDSAPFTVRL